MTTRDPNMGASATARTVVSPTTLSKRQLKLLFMRVGEAIETETRMLRTNPTADLSAANTRKNRCLYELNMVARELDRFDVDAEIRTELAGLRKKVEENGAAVRANLQATKDVIRILGDVISHEESDGTYASVSKLPAG
jgi:hypothetical protein